MILHPELENYPVDNLLFVGAEEFSLVVRLIDLSEGDVDGVRQAWVLVEMWFPWSDLAEFRKVGLALRVLVLLGGEGLYSGMLGSASSLSLLGLLVPSLSLVGVRAGSCCWP